MKFEDYIYYKLKLSDRYMIFSYNPCTKEHFVLVAGDWEPSALKPHSLYSKYGKGSKVIEHISADQARVELIR
jgi:hypothetical protein